MTSDSGVSGPTETTSVVMISDAFIAVLRSTSPFEGRELTQMNEDPSNTLMWVKEASETFARAWPEPENF